MGSLVGGGEVGLRNLLPLNPTECSLTWTHPFGSIHANEFSARRGNTTLSWYFTEAFKFARITQHSTSNNLLSLPPFGPMRMPHAHCSLNSLWTRIRSSEGNNWHGREHRARLCTRAPHPLPPALPPLFPLSHALPPCGCEAITTVLPSCFRPISCSSVCQMGRPPLSPPKTTPAHSLARSFTACPPPPRPRPPSSSRAAPASSQAAAGPCEQRRGAAAPCPGTW